MTILDLPVEPGPTLMRALLQIPNYYQESVLSHLLGNTPAEVLAEILTEAGYPVSASTLRTYRRAVKRAREGV